MWDKVFHESRRIAKGLSLQSGVVGCAAAAAPAGASPCMWMSFTDLALGCSAEMGTIQDEKNGVPHTQRHSGFWGIGLARRYLRPGAVKSDWLHAHRQPMALHQNRPPLKKGDGLGPALTRLRSNPPIKPRVVDTQSGFDTILSILCIFKRGKLAEQTV